MAALCPVQVLPGVRAPERSKRKGEAGLPEPATEQQLWDVVLLLMLH